MTSVVRLEYPDLSTDLVKSELSFAGDSLNVTGQDDQRAVVEVEAGDSPVTITTGSLDDTIIGGSGNDIINGGAGSDNIDGGPGNDNIQGGDGNDVLVIGPGDTVSSGNGKDIFQFDLTQEFTAENAPTIEDFTPGEDGIAILGDENPVEAPVYDKETGTLFIEGTPLVNLGEDLVLPPDAVKVGGSPEPLVLSTIDSTETEVFRFFVTNTGGHFYTTDVNERDFIRQNLDNYVYENQNPVYGTAAPLAVAQDITGTEEVQPEEVYRFFNTSTGAHLYSTNEIERDYIIENLENYKFEGVKFYAYQTQVEGSVAVRRYYDPVADLHFYTSDPNEIAVVEEDLDNFNFENIAYYAMPVDADI